MTRLYTAILVLIFSLFSFGVLKASASERPQIRKNDIEFKLPEIDTYSLSNSLNVSLIEYGNIPKVSIGFRSKFGESNQSTEAITELVYALINEGNENTHAEELSSSLSEIGATLDYFIRDDHSGIDIEVLSSNTGRAFEILAKLLINPSFDDAKFEQIKQDVLLRQQRKYTDTFEKLDNLLALGLKGEKELSDIDAFDDALADIDSSNINAFIKNELLSTDSHIYVSGMFNSEYVKSVISKHFGQVAIVRKNDAVEPKTAPRNQGKIIIVDQPNATQTLVKLGVPLVKPNHQDFDALVLMNTVLGGAVSSRITQNIREDKGYAYYPYSEIENFAGISHWVLFSELSAPNTTKAIDEIFKEIETLKSTPLAVSELNGFQNYTIGQFVFNNFNRNGIIRQLWLQNLNNIPAHSLASFPERIAKLQPSEISAVAQKYIKLDDLVIVLIGDANVLKDQIFANDKLNQYHIFEY